MKTTLFIGSYGFGNLGDELCLIEALQTFGTENNIVATKSEEYTQRCLQTYVSKPFSIITERAQLKNFPTVDTIILGGGGLSSTAVKNHLMWCNVINKPMIIHNVGVGNCSDFEWMKDKNCSNSIKNIVSISTRDHVSEWLWNTFPFDVKVSHLTFFPEKDIAVDDKLMHLIDKREDVFDVGVSMTAQPIMLESVEKNAERIINALVNLQMQGKKMRLIPIVSTIHRFSQYEDDMYGFEYIYKIISNYIDVVKPPATLLSREFWHKYFTPSRLKGLIANTDILLSQRKHNIIHAIGCNKRFIGMHPVQDDSLPRVYFSMREFIEPGSMLIAI